MALVKREWNPNQTSQHCEGDVQELQMFHVDERSSRVVRSAIGGKTMLRYVRLLISYCH